MLLFDFVVRPIMENADTVRLYQKGRMLLSIRSTFFQAIKFGVSGIVGALVSGSIYYMYHGELPLIIRVIHGRPINFMDVSFYVMTSVIGGAVHFTLSKLWVFGAAKKQPSRYTY